MIYYDVIYATEGYMRDGGYLAGMLRVLILSELSRAEGYGYGIARALSERSRGDLRVRPESLYPVLHRMEQEGLITAHWEQSAAGRPRKLYVLTAKGRRRWERSRKAFIAQSRGALKAIGAMPAPGEP
jgi:DNA-binding PadR family transcriptional regulator